MDYSVKGKIEVRLDGGHVPKRRHIRKAQPQGQRRLAVEEAVGDDGGGIDEPGERPPRGSQLPTRC